MLCSYVLYSLSQIHVSLISFHSAYTSSFAKLGMEDMSQSKIVDMFANSLQFTNSKNESTDDFCYDV